MDAALSSERHRLEMRNTALAAQAQTIPTMNPLTNR